MDILRTNIQQQSEQMLLELEAKKNRDLANAVSAVNNKHQVEIQTFNLKVSGLEKQIVDLKATSLELERRHAKMEEVCEYSLNSRFMIQKSNY
jgi:hypothetical protein